MGKDIHVSLSIIHASTLHLSKLTLKELNDIEKLDINVYSCSCWQKMWLSFASPPSEDIFCQVLWNWSNDSLKSRSLSLSLFEKGRCVPSLRINWIFFLQGCFVQKLLKLNECLWRNIMYFPVYAFRKIMTIHLNKIKFQRCFCANFSWNWLNWYDFQTSPDETFLR